MTVMRYSRQREAILQTLRARYDHPTAEMLYHSLRQAHPNISLGTVYRNLSLLEQQGGVMRLQGRDSPDRYDGKTVPHDHLHCRQCGALVDLAGLQDVVSLDAARKAAARLGMMVEGYRITFDGLCSNCTMSAQ